MPILEAMACGIPVVCSNAASLPEVSGGNALFFDPFSEKDMREKILKLYNDNKIRKQNIRNGLQWVKDFTWERSAKKLIEAITC